MTRRRPVAAMSARAVLCGVLIGLLIPGGAQWYAQRLCAGAVFLACAVILGVYASPRFGWPVLLLTPGLALLEQILYWRDHGTDVRR